MFDGGKLMEENLKETKNFFDSMANKWDTVCYHDPDKLKAITTLGNITENAKVADIACGTGVLFKDILIHNPSALWGVDLSDKMLEEASKKFNDERINLWQGDYSKFDQKDFDCVFIYSAYPHFPNKSEFARKTASILKKGGRFILAHSESRHEINHRHSQGAEHVSDILSEVSEERRHFDELFDIDITADTEFIYIISGTKK